MLIYASVEDIQRLKRAMAFLTDSAIALIANDEVEKYQVVRIADEIVVPPGTAVRISSEFSHLDS